MSPFDDYEADSAFERDYPFGLPCSVWMSKQGEIRVADMTDEHIKNCMRIVGEDDAWYAYFANELKRRVVDNGNTKRKEDEGKCQK